MRFNIGFTPEIAPKPGGCGHTLTINHAHPPFTENKRCWTKPRAIGDVVNRKAVSVYQTNAVLILMVACKGRLKRALHDATVTKQYRVRRCSKECLLRSSPAHLF
jgi:hypothetical protein